MHQRIGPATDLLTYLRWYQVGHHMYVCIYTHGGGAQTHRWETLKKGASEGMNWWMCRPSLTMESPKAMWKLPATCARVHAHAGRLRMGTGKHTQQFPFTRQPTLLTSIKPLRWQPSPVCARPPMLLRLFSLLLESKSVGSSRKGRPMGLPAIRVWGFVLGGD